MENKLKTFELKNSKGTKITVTNYGGKIISIILADKKGNFNDIVLGYDTAQEYLEGDKYFGATIGRFANRISKGKFILNEKEYDLSVNNGPNHLHGGFDSFVNKIWEAEQKGNSIHLKYFSKNGEENYPGNLDFQVVYTLNEDNEFIIDYKAQSDEDTYINFTQHSFFNLKGEGNGDILSHELFLNADFFTPLDNNQIPTGEIKSVKDTPFDFLKSKEIGRDINKNDAQLKIGKGYDINFVLNKSEEAQLCQAAELFEKSSGRFMQVLTTEPGIQLYTGNWLGAEDDKKGKGGKRYVEKGAVCLETQHFPDSPNKTHFPSTKLKKGDVFKSRTIFKFGVK